MAYTVILVGASGLIGSNLLSMLIESDEISRILLLVRKSLKITNHKVQELIINFDELEKYSSEIRGDIIYSCLGTTKAASPDKNLYRKIGVKNGIAQFHLVSALDANAAATNSYLKLKGELEKELKKISIISLHIYQPSLLTGNRIESRTAEKIAISAFKLIDPLLRGPLKKYRSIKAETVAQAMLNQSLKNLKGTFTYPSKLIQELA
jgi:uncharacterized protein YbjT (DUF2867 family)